MASDEIIELLSEIETYRRTRAVTAPPSRRKTPTITPNRDFHLDRFEAIAHFGSQFDSTSPINLLLDSRTPYACEIYSPIVIEIGIEVRVQFEDRFLIGKVVAYNRVFPRVFSPRRFTYHLELSVQVPPTSLGEILSQF